MLAQIINQTSLPSATPRTSFVSDIRIYINSIVEKFINEQDVFESSKNIYRRTLKQFFEYIKSENLNLNTIDRTNILNYKNSLLNAGKSSLTVGSYLTAVRKFYEWTEANKIYPNIAKGIKTPPKKQQFKKQPLQVEQAKELLQVYSDNKRNNAIINLLLRTGLRTIEVVRANVSDITYKAGTRVLMIQGKGRTEKDNFVILRDSTYNAISEYLTERGAKDNEPLFTSTSNNNKGQRLTTKTISTIAKKGLQSIGLNDKSYTAHSLRHTTAVTILRAGGSLNDAQETLRHTNPATTQIYTATIKEEQRLKHNGETLIDSLF